MRSLLRRDGVIALLLFALASTITGVAGTSEGFTRDEGYYFDAAEDYWGFFGDLGDAIVDGKPLRALDRAHVDRWFGYNHEHPALMKELFGISWRLFHKCNCPRQPGRHPVAYTKKHRTIPLLGEAEAMRLPADLFAGLLVAITYLFAARAFSRRAGLVAAVLALAAPRIFFNAELSCFDAPMATTWLLAVYCWWRSLDEPRWAWRAGAAFGIALATKLNAFFLPAIFLAHYLWVHRHTLRQRKLPPLPLAFLWMAVLGPIIMIGHWPWMWFDTIHVGLNRAGHLVVDGRFPDYMQFHLNHVYYNMEFLGVNYNKPPFPKSYAFVMTLFTAPVTTMALAGLGVFFLVRGFRAAPRSASDGTEPMHARPTMRRPAGGRSTAPGALVLLNALYPMSILALTGAPIFGATKHWLPAIPFIAILAGVGADQLCRALAQAMGWQGRAAAIAGLSTVVLACAPALAETWRSHPYGLTHYNLLAGGPAGGADRGMNRQFWGYSTRGLLSWIDEHAKPGAPIYWHDTNQPILNMDVREHLLRDDIGNTGLEEPGVRASTMAMVIHEKHFAKYEYWIWDFYGTTRPSIVLDDEGVPMVTLYERPPAGRGVTR